MGKFLLFIFLFSCLFASAKTDSVFVIDSFPPTSYTNFANNASPAVELNKFWKYHKGDNPLWADSSLNESDWQTVNSSLDMSKLPEKTFERIGWFRIHLQVDSHLVNKTLGFMISQEGASEIYLDGKLLHSFGNIDQKDVKNEKRYNPKNLPVDIRFEKTSKHVLAVRYANARALSNFKKINIIDAGFKIRIGNLRDNVVFRYMNSVIISSMFVFYATFFFALSFLHFVFFLFYRKDKSNLYFSIFAGALGFLLFWIFLQSDFLLPDVINALNYFANSLSDVYMPALVAMLYTIFYNKIPKIFWLWFFLSLVDFVSSIFNIDLSYFGSIVFLLLSLEALRIVIVSIFKKRPGAWIFAIGIASTIFFFLLFTVASLFGTNVHIGGEGWVGLISGLLAIYATLSIPISMSIYLAREFSRTSKSLAKKLVEVEDLSARTIAQEKEKQEILSKQKENLEIEVEARTREVVQQKKVIEEKNKDITDSINYAKRIQDAILPSEEQIKKMLPESFVLFKPKDIVSGDFYFFAEVDGKIIASAVDCTGHGVPGGFMSMVGANHLKRIVTEQKITDTSKILDELHKQVLHSLNRDISKRDSKDGMDAAIISIDKNKKEVQFSGAVRPLYYFVNGKFNEVKGERYSIAGVKEIGSAPYASTTISVTAPTTFYLFSDGFADQFGGKDGKKLMSKNFRDILGSIQNNPLSVQKTFLENFIEEWKGSREQMDDIMVIGIKL